MARPIANAASVNSKRIFIVFLLMFYAVELVTEELNAGYHAPTVCVYTNQRSPSCRSAAESCGY